MITKNQEEALESIMEHSDDGSDATKAILFFLIKKSDLLTKSVCITLLDSEGVSRDLINEVATHTPLLWHRFNKTKLASLFQLIGSDFHFIAWPGDYEDGEWKSTFDTHRHSITIWLRPFSGGVDIDHAAERNLFHMSILKQYLPAVDEPF